MLDNEAVKADSERKKEEDQWEDEADKKESDKQTAQQIDQGWRDR